MKSVGVIGSGQMGLGIALVAASKAKADVLLMDAKKSQLDKGLKYIGKMILREIDLKMVYRYFIGEGYTKRQDNFR